MYRLVAKPECYYISVLVDLVNVLIVIKGLRCFDSDVLIVIKGLRCFDSDVLIVIEGLRSSVNIKTL